MSKVKLALMTQNEHKLRELTPLFQQYGVEFEAVALEKLEIRSDSVEEIARTAVLHAYDELERPVVLDDTGFFIEALNGFPRAYPAFVLATIGRKGILKLMRGVENRSAYFITAVGYTDDGENAMTFVGKMPGLIAQEERGTGGFGYDPIFIPEGFTDTYAQLPFSKKVEISHRTRAFTAFLQWFTSTDS